MTGQKFFSIAVVLVFNTFLIFVLNLSSASDDVSNDDDDDKSAKNRSDDDWNQPVVLHIFFAVFKCAFLDDEAFLDFCEIILDLKFVPKIFSPSL